jgi:hypothetical protein
LSAFAQEGVIIKTGFLTGNDYLKANKEKRAFYAMGIVDGVLLSPLFGAPKNTLSWFESCTVNMTNDQVEAIISKYLENHPGEWHQYLNIIAFDAMSEACKRYK